MPTDSRKKSIYFPKEFLREIEAEAERLDRSVSWLVKFAWKNSRNKLMLMSSPTECDPET